MIACDICDLWFHPRCFNITLVSKQVSKLVEHKYIFYANMTKSNFIFISGSSYFWNNSNRPRYLTSRISLLCATPVPQKIRNPAKTLKTSKIKFCHSPPTLSLLFQRAPRTASKPWLLKTRQNAARWSHQILVWLWLTRRKRRTRNAKKLQPPAAMKSFNKSRMLKLRYLSGPPQSKCPPVIQTANQKKLAALFNKMQTRRQKVPFSQVILPL